jgi:ATP-dependent exoDNAse (exonuclease V) beta subunit
MESLLSRNYRYSDIAILTPRNEDAVRVTSWLNDFRTPFISFSSLDIRRRKLTGEIVSLLRFLDSPTDNLSFATFLLGEVFKKTFSPDEATRFEPHAFLSCAERGRPLYKGFQRGYPDLWDGYFSDLFRCAGYFPLYDLLTQVCHRFRLFDIFADEEATLIRLLETAKDFEGQGFNNLANFLAFAGDLEAEETEWHMKVPESQDAVKVMTIHKAKGLGFPVVVMLLYERRSRGFEFVVNEEGETFSLLKITGDIAQVDDGLGALYRAEELKEQVNSLNSLYVGFTRPEQELYIIGVAADAEKNTYPLELLPFEDYKEAARPVREAAERPSGTNDARLTHRHEAIVFPAPAAAGLNIREKQRGDLVHAALAGIGFVEGGTESAVRAAVARLETDGMNPDDIADTLREFLDTDGVAGYFSPKKGRSVWTEKEVADASGRLFRIDRLVVDEEAITIMDFKTGEEDAQEAHLIQMKNYMQIVRGIYPRHEVTGLIAYVDLRKVRSVS